MGALTFERLKAASEEGNEIFAGVKNARQQMAAGHSWLPVGGATLRCLLGDANSSPAITFLAINRQTQVLFSFNKFKTTLLERQPPMESLMMMSQAQIIAQTHICMLITDISFPGPQRWQYNLFHEKKDLSGTIRPNAVKYGMQ